MQKEIGYYNYDKSQLAASSALSTVKLSAEQKAVPLLWMPSQAEAMLEDFENVWNEADSHLLPARILLIITLGPLCVLALMVVCAPLLPKEHRRAWRRWRAKKFDIKDMYGSLRYHLDHAYPASPSGDSFRDHFPSCTWRGYYKQYGSRHNLCSFSLQFSESTSGVFSIDGGGQDDVGRYGIDGEWNPVTRRLAFVKEYELGSRTINGHIDWRENKGHRVLYKGEGLATPGQGFKGTWSLDVNSFRDQGEFHLWPEELPALSSTWFRLPEASAPPMASEEPCSAAALSGTELAAASAPPLQVYEATPDGVCVVCLDRRISVALAPCGHIAACAACACRLPSNLCPICRRPVDHIIPCRSNGGPRVTSPFESSGF